MQNNMTLKILDVHYVNNMALLTYNAQIYNALIKKKEH